MPTLGTNTGLKLGVLGEEGGGKEKVSDLCFSVRENLFVTGSKVDFWATVCNNDLPLFE